MDVFYEESSIAREGAKEAKKYKVVHIISNVFLVLGIFGLLFGFFYVPMNSAWLVWGFICSWFFIVWFILFKLKARYNVNYDYCFVSGELRIARVVNINKRKPLTRIQAEEIIQIGDLENTAFEGLRADPNTKTVYCTSNIEPADDKFFMYIWVNDNGRKLYVLECREELLLHIMRFVKRTVLESDYVMQEKKKNRI